MSRASTLLQKANTQLRGERVPIKSKEEDELTKYLSSLTQKTGQQTKSVNFEDFGENISISSESNVQKTPRPIGKTPTLGGAASRFLKKKTPDVETQDQGNVITPVASPRGSRRSYRQVTSIPGVSPEKSTPGQAKTTSPQKTTALDKAKALTNKINDRGAAVNKRGAYFETDTDDSVSLANYMHHASADQLKSASEKAIGRDGNRFLKKKPLEEPENVSTQKIDAPRPSTPNRGQRRPVADKDAPKPVVTPAVPEYAHKGQKKYTASIQLTSEEESMAEFMNRLSSADEARNKKRANKNQKAKGRDLQSPDLSFKRSPSPPSRTPKRTPSPIYGRRYSRSPSQDSDNVDSIRSEVADTQETDSSGNIFNTVNLLDLDSLEPLALSPEPEEKKAKSSKKTKKDSKLKSKTKPKEPAPSIFKASAKEDIFKAKSSPAKKKDTKKSSSFFTNLGLHTVDELLGASENRDESAASEVSEIITEKSDIFAAKKRKDSVSSIASEIVQETSQQHIYSESFEEESITEKIGQGSIQGGKQVRWSAGSEVKTEYSDDMTEKSYDDDFESDSRVRSYTRSDDGETDGYTSDTETYTRSYTDSRRSPSPRPSNRKETKSVEIQTGTEPGLGYNWNMMSSGLAISGPGYGLGFVDPTPIASHVVSADALEAMTSYSPCMLALQDLLKQQLVLTQNFLATQRRIYEASTATLEEDYKYTTLEGTKEYIRKHRKPRLTFKQALKMVSREMDR